jgi:hypothetical protein
MNTSLIHVFSLWADSDAGALVNAAVLKICDAQRNGGLSSLALAAHRIPGQCYEAVSIEVLLGAAVIASRSRTRATS